MTATRRLAAILAADVAGYSRLIGADEGGTLQALKAIRAELIDPTIATHNGRLVKTTGDGLLVEFGSVVDALSCATEVQAGMAERNTAVPNERRIEDAGSALAALRAHEPTLASVQATLTRAYRHREGVDHVLAGLRLAGMPEE